MFRQTNALPWSEQPSNRAPAKDLFTQKRAECFQSLYMNLFLLSEIFILSKRNNYFKKQIDIEDILGGYFNFCSNNNRNNYRKFIANIIAISHMCRGIGDIVTIDNG